MPHVREQHLRVLEGVQHAALLLEGGRAGEARLELPQELVPPAERPLPPVVEHWQQVLGLPPQEVLPQEWARAEQARELAQPLGCREERQSTLRRGPGQHLVHELRERAQRRRGIRRERQQVRELLEQRDRGAQRGELDLVLDPAPVAERDQEAVARLAADVRDLDLLHVDAAHRERVGERVEEARRVGAAHLHPREVLVLLVVEDDLERLERDGRRLGAREALGEAPIETVSRLVRAALGDEPEQLAQLVLQLALEIRRRARRAVVRLHPELVHDQAAGGRRAGGGRSGREPPPAPEHLVARGRRAGCRGVHVARFDVEPRGGEQPAQQRELGEEVEPDDRDVEPPTRRLAHLHPRAPGRAELGGEAVVEHDFVLRVARRVGGAHALHELADCPGVVAHTPPCALRPRAGKSKAGNGGTGDEGTDNVKRQRRLGGAGGSYAAPRTPRRLRTGSRGTGS